jgi:hypothetical protein
LVAIVPALESISMVYNAKSLSLALPTIEHLKFIRRNLNIPSTLLPGSVKTGKYVIASEAM